jgi:hypothetical protein
MLVLIAVTVMASGIVGYRLHKKLPYPVCVLVDGRSDASINGLDDAAIVYEWIKWTKRPRIMAVFINRTQAKIGPLGPVQLGSAYLAKPYGYLAFGDSMLPPEYSEWFTNITGSPVLLIPMSLRGSQLYITLSDVLSEIERGRVRIIPEEGCLLARGSIDIGSGGRQCQTIIGRHEDGSEIFRWAWDGKSYRRDLDGESIRVKALVVIHTSSDLCDYGHFPEGLLSEKEGGQATVYVAGQRTNAKWVSFVEPLYLLNEDEPPSLLTLPPGQIWFHIVTNDAQYSIEEGVAQ